MPDLHSALMVAVVALVTIALRFAPFVIFSAAADQTQHQHQYHRKGGKILDLFHLYFLLNMEYPKVG